MIKYIGILFTLTLLTIGFIVGIEYFNNEELPAEIEREPVLVTDVESYVSGSSIYYDIEVDTLHTIVLGDRRLYSSIVIDNGYNTIYPYNTPNNRRHIAWINGTGYLAMRSRPTMGGLFVTPEVLYENGWFTLEMNFIDYELDPLVLHDYITQFTIDDIIILVDEETHPVVLLIETDIGVD